MPSTALPRVAPLLVVPEDEAAVGVVRPGVLGAVGEQPALQHRDRREGLERRTRRVGVERAVDQREVAGRSKYLSAVAGDEVVGVEGRVRRHRHDRARARVEHDDRAGVGRVVVAVVRVDERCARRPCPAASDSSAMCCVVEVDGERTSWPASGCLHVDRRSTARPSVVDLDLVLARHAAQLRFERLLDARLPDGVVGLVAPRPAAPRAPPR